MPPAILSAFLVQKLKVPGDLATQITELSYKRTKLGNFLTPHFEKHGIKAKVAAKTGGTLASHYKIMLAEFVFNQMALGKFGWDDLKNNEVIADILPKLYQFIKLHNK